MGQVSVNVRHGSEAMTIKQKLCLSVAAVGAFALAAAAPAQVRAQTAVAIDNDDIGGVVTGSNGSSSPRSARSAA